MTVKQVSIGAVLCLTVSWSTGVFAQSAANKLSLEQAVQIGVKQNYAVKAARNDWEASKWGLRQAYTSWLPKVGVNSGFTRLDNETVRRANIFVDMAKDLGMDPSDIRPAAYRRAYGTSLTVIQPIYNGGAEWSSIRMSRAGQRMSRHALEDAEREVKLKIKRVYFGVLKAQEMVALAKEAVESTEQHLIHARRMLEVGSRNRADVLRWEVQLAQDQGKVIEAENGLAIAKATLDEVLGVEPGQEYELVPVSMDEIPERALAEGAIGRSVVSHPSVRQLEAGVDLQRANVQLASGGFQPKVNLIYNYSWEQDDDIRLDGDETWSVAVQVNFPIFNSLGNYSAVRKAKADLHKIEAVAEGVRRGIELQATSASLNLKAARTRIGIARKGVEQAEENLRIVQNMYDVGTLANIDFIDAQLARNSTRTNLINAVYDFYIAEAELERALGQ